MRVPRIHLLARAAFAIGVVALTIAVPAPVLAQSDTGTTSFDVNGLSAVTAYSFRVAAAAADGTLSTFSSLATATTLATLVPACQPGTIAVTPSAVKRSNGASTATA